MALYPPASRLCRSSTAPATSPSRLSRRDSSVCWSATPRASRLTTDKEEVLCSHCQSQSELNCYPPPEPYPLSSISTSRWSSSSVSSPLAGPDADDVCRRVLLGLCRRLGPSSLGDGRKPRWPSTKASATTRCDHGVLHFVFLPGGQRPRFPGG